MDTANGINSDMDNISVIKEILDLQARESISSDQIRRVVDPVAKMIREGRFDKSRRPVLRTSKILAATVAPQPPI